jgi:opacity protein-like surface antigen
MRHVQVLALAGATALYATASLAADLGPFYPPPPPPQESFSGWYLRGDIGMTNQSVGNLFNVLDATATSVTTVQKGFDSSMLFGLGVGYQWNDWLRTDITGEYRSKANFHGLQIVNSGGLFTDEYRASKSEWLFLANAYVDLGTWWHFTPFIGAGIGMTNNMISDFLDVNTPNLGVAFGRNTDRWDMAWALHAGVAYQVTPSLTIELAYRYVDLGKAVSGDIQTFTGVNAVNNPEEFRHLTSHDVKLGVRWSFGNDYAPPPPPISPRG